MAEPEIWELNATLIDLTQDRVITASVWISNGIDYLQTIW
jgi:hypothetical protein